MAAKKNMHIVAFFIHKYNFVIIDPLFPFTFSTTIFPIAHITTTSAKPLISLIPLLPILTLLFVQ